MAKMAGFLVYCMVLMLMLVPKINANCAFEAIFAFGDSNTDTGGFYAAFPSQPYPYGITYFNKPTGRATDGRLYIDFLAQALGLPFLSPYLQSIGSDYKHGVNFATAASTVLQPHTSLFDNGVSPFYLQVQINQMKQFKAKVDEYKDQENTNLPQPDVFGKALYVIYIGQNDFTGYVSSAGPGGSKDIAGQTVPQIVSAIKELYALGGRTFMVLNLAPIGCYPAFLTQFSHEDKDIDSYGCMTSYNNAVNEYNSQLKWAIQQCQQDLSDAKVVYVDTNSVVLDLFHNPASHGLQHGPTVCCGYGGGLYNYNQEVFCGNFKEIEGHRGKFRVTTSVCYDPQNYASWDGVHLTEAANKIVANAIVSGSNSEPQFYLNNYCDVQPIVKRD